MDGVKTSVIIPTLNEEHFVGNILTDLQKQTHKPYEIFVVDGQSNDNTQKVVKSFKNITLMNGPRNQGQQRNLAASKAKGEMLLFLDADAKIDSDFIEKSLKEMKNRNLNVAIPKYVPYPESNPYFKRFAVVANFAIAFAAVFNPYGGATAMFVQKNVFDKTKGFHPRYKLDDVPLIREAAQHGKYGILETHAYLSERRFLKYGVAKMSIKYFVLYSLLIFNLY